MYVIYCKLCEYYVTEIYIDEDGLADPSCVKKYRERQEEEEDTGEKGPNGQRMLLCDVYDRLLMIYICNIYSGTAIEEYGEYIEDTAYGGSWR